MHKRRRPIAPLLALALVLAAYLSGCVPASAPQAVQTPAGFLGGDTANLLEGTLNKLTFLLLDSAPRTGNTVVSPPAQLTLLAAAQYAASADTQAQYQSLLGTQGQPPKYVNERARAYMDAALRAQGARFTSAWALFLGENQPVRESYLTDCAAQLGMTAQFIPFTADTAADQLDDWVDEATQGAVRTLDWPLAEQPAPFLGGVFECDFDFPSEVSPNMTKLLPFDTGAGEQAIPTLVVMQSCGLYQHGDASVAVLPLAWDNLRLVLLMPPQDTPLEDFCTAAMHNADQWKAQAQWGAQRVLVPVCSARFSGSMDGLLTAAGAPDLLAETATYANMGGDLRLQDITCTLNFTIDASGQEPAAPNLKYHPNVADDVPTLAFNRPFIALLERTQDGAIVCAAVIRDPLGQ